MESVMPGSTRVHVQMPPYRVPLDFQDMGVPADQQTRSLFINQLANPRIVLPRTACYMGHDNRKSLNDEKRILRILNTQVSAVDISVDRAQRHFVTKRYSYRTIPNVTGMPDLIGSRHHFQDLGPDIAMGIR